MEGEQEKRGTKREEGSKEDVASSAQCWWEVKQIRNSIVPNGFRCEEVPGDFGQSSFSGVMGAEIRLHRQWETGGNEHVALFQEPGWEGRRMTEAGMWGGQLFLFFKIERLSMDKCRWEEAERERVKVKKWCNWGKEVPETGKKDDAQRRWIFLY